MVDSCRGLIKWYYKCAFIWIILTELLCNYEFCPLAVQIAFTQINQLTRKSRNSDSFIHWGVGLIEYNYFPKILAWTKVKQPPSWLTSLMKSTKSSSTSKPVPRLSQSPICAQTQPARVKLCTVWNTFVLVATVPIQIAQTYRLNRWQSTCNLRLELWKTLRPEWMTFFMES